VLRKLSLSFLCALLLAAALLALVFAQQSRALSQPLRVSADYLLDVPRGASVDGMLLRMQRDGLLEDAFWARLAWRFNHAGATLHSGEYRLTPGLSLEGLFALWQDGTVMQHELTLVEGWNLRQLRSALARTESLQQTLGNVTDEQLLKHLGLPGGHAEGRFFPDTYRFPRGTTDAQLLRRAARRLDDVLAEEWAKRANNLPFTEPYQALVMASLIEKETGAAHERKQIAGVFARRLAKGMRLQTDPTVIYGMGERYNGKLKRADLLERTPYNTYQIDGLPPTPIALAGRAAIHAALHPAPGNSLYFVARGDGSHAFSDSLDAHNSAVREFQLKRRADYRSTPQVLSEKNQ